MKEEHNEPMLKIAIHGERTICEFILGTIINYNGSTLRHEIASSIELLSRVSSFLSYPILRVLEDYK
jgi:hypothetical protein